MTVLLVSLPRYQGKTDHCHCHCTKCASHPTYFNPWPRREFMSAESLQQSFWLILLVTFIMVGFMISLAALDELRAKLLRSAPRITRNWTPWVITLQQTIQGLETIAYTVYGNAVGTFVLLVYLDVQHNFPTFLYFLPVYMFLAGFYAINQEGIRSYSLRSQVEDVQQKKKVETQSTPVATYNKANLAF